MSSALLDSFLAAGGEVRFHTAVTGILTGRGRVRGVRLADGQVGRTPLRTPPAS
ncbi:hypothetical protein [Streptomyces wedmorensis]|uniref:hypothetical protein n=1 Tax=Streptomyces wedmorensis TaxID=43759 RepID=UPI0037BC6988